MDTSSKYVKMCQQATEIQEQWKPTGGDWYLHDYRGSTGACREFETAIWGDDDQTWRIVEILCWRPSTSKDVVVSTDGRTSLCVSAADLTRKHAVWLPRQDQLQEMVKDLFHGYRSLIEVFTEANFYFSPNWSMEQRWLAFVMRQKYQKRWNGTDWAISPESA